MNNSYPLTTAAKQLFGDHWCHEQAISVDDCEEIEQKLIDATVEVTRLKEQLRQFHAGEVVAPAGDHALSIHVARQKDEEIKFLKAKLGGL